jgi:transcriptional regulator with XRE-family HTH domain
MTLQAHFGSKPQSPDRRSQPRKKLRLLTEARSVRSGTAAVFILDISTTGILVQADLPLEQGEVIEIQLPGTGVHQARIVWSGGKFFGCSFEIPITSGALSAALLKGLPGDSAAPEASMTSAPSADFGHRLASLRGERGWSIEDLAARLGVSRQAVWYWETGQRQPRPRLFKRVAEIFEVSVDALLSRASGYEAADAVSIIEEFRNRIADRMGCDTDQITISIEF